MSDHNPYAAPGADVTPVERPRSIPESIAKKIKGAWIAALISAAVTLVFSLMSVQKYGLGNLLDVALILGLAFGIYKRSRACAVAMFAYFVVSKIINAVGTGSANGLVMGLIFLYFYWQGVVGTYQYRKFIKESPEFEETNLDER